MNDREAQIVDGPKGIDFLRTAIEDPNFSGLKADGVRKLIAFVDQLRSHLGGALTVIEGFRPLVRAVQAFREYPVRAHDCPGFDCATCPPRGELERAWEGIADMVSDADAEVGR